MQFNTSLEVGARFKLIVRKASDDSIARETDWFKNLVLNTGLARMSVDTWIDRCCVGTGNSTPVATQVQLDSFVASTTTQLGSSTNKQISRTPYYYSASITWRFAQGVAAGNISEVGLGWGNSDLWNRALIKDASGNPTTITVISDEYLDVISEIRVYPATLSGSFNLLDKSGNTISTHSYNVVPMLWGSLVLNFNPIRLGSAGSSYVGYKIRVVEGGIQGVTTQPNGDGQYFDQNSTSYPSQTSARTVATLPLNSGNIAQKTIICRNTLFGDLDMGYQIEISPAITKTSSQIMTYTFELSWGRYAS